MVYWRETHYVGVDYDNLLAGELAVDGSWLQPPRVLTSLGQLRVRFVRPLRQGGYAISLIGNRSKLNESRTFLMVTGPGETIVRGPSVIYPACRQGQDGLAVNPSGTFLLTWTNAGTGLGRVLSQVFSRDGKPLGKAVRVHEVDEEDDGKVTHFLGGDVAADSAGNFFVVWEAGGEPGNGLEVWGRLFRPAGPKRILNSYHPNDQYDPTVAASPDGRLASVWSSDEQDGDFDGVFGQVFAIPSESSAVRRWSQEENGPAGGPPPQSPGLHGRARY